MSAFKEFFYKNKKLIIGGTTGLVIGILFLTIGFFPTLLLIVLVGIGMLFGATPDLRLKIKSAVITFFNKIFKKG